MKKKLLYSILGIVIFLLSARLIIPYGAKLYVEDKYGVEISHCKFDGLTNLEFINITSNKIKPFNGTLKRVNVDWFQKTVKITGGYVRHHYGDKKKAISSKSRKEWNVTVYDLDVYVAHDLGTVSLQDVNYYHGVVFAERAFGNLNRIRFDATGLKYMDKIVAVEYATVYHNYDIQLPTFNPGKKINLTKVTFSIFSKKGYIGGAEYGPIQLGKTEINASNNQITADISEISVKHHWFGKERVKFKGIALKYIGDNKIRLFNHGAFAMIDLNELSIKGSGSCLDWVAMAPKIDFTRIESLDDFYFIGNLSFEVGIKPPAFKLEQNCQFKCSSHLIRSLFASEGFAYVAYKPDGQKYIRITSPSRKTWTPLESISPHVVRSVVALEDPGFYSHKGIIPNALKNSLIANLQTGKFSRGGSTITMQLAKNLWLGREKTITRKIHEAMMTMALESCMTKDRILEFYLNVVEFGPKIYGIGAASQYYFNKSPALLDEIESFYLAMILPRPNSSAPPNQGGLIYASKLRERLKKNGGI